MKRLRSFNKFYRRYEVDLWGRAGYQRVNKTVRFLQKIQREKIRFSINPGSSFSVTSKKKSLDQSTRETSVDSPIYKAFVPFFARVRNNLERYKRFKKQKEKKLASLNLSKLSACSQKFRVNRLQIIKIVYQLNKIASALKKNQAKRLLLNIILARVLIKRKDSKELVIKLRKQIAEYKQKKQERKNREYANIETNKESDSKITFKKVGSVSLKHKENSRLFYSDKNEQFSKLSFKQNSHKK